MQQKDADRLLARFGDGLRYVISTSMTAGNPIGFAASTTHPLLVEFRERLAGKAVTMPVYQQGSRVFFFRDVVAFRNIEGTIIDGSLSEAEEASRRQQATIAGMPYEIRDPRMVIARGSIEFSGFAVLDGYRISCTRGGIALTNSRDGERAFDDEFAFTWMEKSTCSVDGQQFRRQHSQWVRDPAGSSTTTTGRIEPTDDPQFAADIRGLTKLRSYRVGGTTFGRFQSDFGDYFTPSTLADPATVAGLILKPLYYSRQIDAPVEQMMLLEGSNRSSRVADELLPYVGGVYVLGFLAPATGNAMEPISFQQSPERFHVIAALLFNDGLLASIKLADVEY